MDYDQAPPMPVGRYREYQRQIPGLDDLYQTIAAILDSQLPQRARVLISGAGGGRELEVLADSPRHYELVGVDPSQDMLQLADGVIPFGARQRVQLVQGIVQDLPADSVFAAATSVLIMHFLPDDGAKISYLSAIRRRLRPGAAYIHVDVCAEGTAEVRRLAPVLAGRAMALGLPFEAPTGAATYVESMCQGEHPAIVNTARLEALLREAGFQVVAPFFRGLWYCGWWAEVPSSPT